MKKIFKWFKKGWNKLNKGSRLAWLGIMGIILGVVSLIYTFFLRGNDDGMDKKIKNTQKNNNRVSNSGRKFLRNRKKFKRKKL